MKRFCFALLTLLCSCTLMAQSTFTEKIQRSEGGQGKLRLHQTQAIADLVNGRASAPASSAQATKKPAATTTPSASGLQAGEDAQAEATDPTVDTDLLQTPERKMRVPGFRIQVYSGDNTRKAKGEAAMMGRRVKSYFSELPVYTNFVSPHWICRVGDFKTNEEAVEYLRQLRETGRFEEAVIVRCKVSVSY